ncbi:solute carrier family 22 member 3-like [Nymphalis io]|uniref:solute carrier family 22 member 3-like n=1 Tax=Inachis io TaxID=171585 RepID=UPI002168C289|nr:solute carrier family 22 member 3-like [Nymphalis io]
MSIVKLSPIHTTVKYKLLTQSKAHTMELVDIGSALETVIKHVGEIGLYQRLLFLVMMPFGMVWSFVYFGQMFITATPQEHWCRVPELDGLSADLRRSLSIPKISDTEYDQCFMFDANWTQVLETMLAPDADTPTIPCSDGWEFLFEDIPYSTIVNEREWVCDKSSLVPWSQTISFFGSIVGGILCGTLADKYGRLPVLMWNTSIALYFGGGCLLLPWISLWISNWKFLSLAMALPALLVLATPFIVPESARWLISKGKTDEAVKVLKKFERINQSKIPDDVLENFIAVANKSKEKEESVFMIFKTPSLRVMVTFLIISFMGVALMFDSVIRLSENLGLDFFLTFTVTSLTEIPSIIILVLLLDRIGRRWFVTAPMMIAGVLCLIAAFVPRGMASVALAVTARLFNNMSYGTVIQWTPELLPTSVRASGASFVHISAFAAVMLSPFIIYSDRVWEGLSLIIVGVIGIIASCVALLLPETKGRRMPQTIDNWETLAATTCFAKKQDAVNKTRCR